MTQATRRSYGLRLTTFSGRCGVWFSSAVLAFLLVPVGTVAAVDPTPVCPDDITVSNDLSSCGAAVNFTAPAGTTCEDQSGNPVSSGSFFPVGMTTVTCTDTVTSSLNCSFKITVNDDEKPTITCPMDITVNADASTCGTTATWAPPLASDNCDTSVDVVCTPASGSVFGLGSTLVTCTATDDAGNMEVCMFNVVVQDTTKPVIDCPDDFTVAADFNTCGTSVTWAVPVATDNCDQSLTISCSPPSGSVFGPGTTPVTCTAEDAAGNKDTCTFLVHVVDETKPAVSCPSDIVIKADSATCGTTVTYKPKFNDNCPGATLSCVPPSGSFFPVGVTPVTCTATDAAGNTASCSFNVEVQDMTSPTIDCPADVTVSAASDSCGTTVFWDPPAVGDNCDGATAVCSPPSGSDFPLGTTEVKCTVTDASGNMDMCTFSVTVVDDTKPVISCPGNIFVPNAAGKCTAAVNFSATVTDNCPGVSVVCVPPSGFEFPVGITPVTCTATDAAGNMSMCSFNVTVTDDENPTAICPADINVSNDAGMCGAVVNFSADFTDNCPGGSVSCSPPSGSFFAVGTTVVTCTATDAGGNTDTCMFSVTVTDDEVPTALCKNTDISLSDMGMRTIGPDRIDAGSTDNCGIASLELDKTKFTCDDLGENTVTLTVTDVNGNISSCTGTVTVYDNRPPVLECPPDTVRVPNEDCVYLPPDGGGASLLGSPSVSDNCTPTDEIILENNAPPAFVVGTTEVVWTATDASGNSTSCTQLVTVSPDQTPPTLVCPPDTVRVADEHCEYSPPDGGGASRLGEVTVSDNCSAPGAIIVTNDAPASLGLGVHEVTWTAEDEAGNTATCVQLVTVVDETAPSLTCPPSISRNANSGDSYVPGDGDLGEPTVSDECTDTDDIVVTNDAPSSFPLGTTAVEWTATDEAGNTSKCTQMVTVVDSVAPEITCPPSLTVEVNVDNGWVGDFGMATATDADSDDDQIVITNDAPGVFPLGTTVVIWTAMDTGGNSSSCPQEVTVVDLTPPTIECSENISTVCEGAEGAVVEYTTTASDNIPGEVTLICDPPSGSMFPPGITVVNCTATDASGNVSECSFVVDVDCGGLALPGDCNADGSIDLSDAVCILMILFTNAPIDAPCGDGEISNAANVKLLSWNGTDDVDLASAVALLNWKFAGGPPHVLGTECTPIDGCEDICDL